MSLALQRHTRMQSTPGPCHETAPYHAMQNNMELRSVRLDQTRPETREEQTRPDWTKPNQTSKDQTRQTGPGQCVRGRK